MQKSYTASLSQTQGRKGWSAIFRSPLKRDSKGIGIRVRKGLGTSDNNEAQELVKQLNELLSNEYYHNIEAKVHAEKKFDLRVVKAFYGSIESSHALGRKYWEIRDKFLPLPSSNEGYTKVLLLGNIGVGKTTLLRQLIGSDPDRDRFPSIAPGRTTTSDIEIIMAEGPYEAVVTFIHETETQTLIEECVVKASVAADNGKNPSEIADQLMEHEEQRFRLNYILGNYEISDDENQNNAKNEVIENYIQRIIKIASLARAKTKEQFDFESIELKGRYKEDAQELFEKLISEQEEFGQLVDDIMDEIEKRFSPKYIHEGNIFREREEDWPQYWEIRTDNREKFLEEIRKFSSNYADWFGTLLTPIVEGIRIRGPLYPSKFTVEHPKLVLIDGEGLGHTLASAFSLPPSLTRKFDDADIILLVDNAASPMLGSSLTVLKHVGASGHHSKLAIAFTHFDLMDEADNLRTPKAKKNHVLKALKSGLAILKDDLTRSVLYNLEQNLENRCFFFSNLQKNISHDKDMGIEMLRLFSIFEPAKEISYKFAQKPKYDDASLLLAMQKATKEFQTRWNAILGLTNDPSIRPEHWARVKALSRRYAETSQQQYSTLNPIGDYIISLIKKISAFLDDPKGWEPGIPSDEKKQEIINAITRKTHTRLHPLAYNRLVNNRKNEWTVAYWRRGPGSTRIRARDIEAIFEKAAPLINEVPDTYEIKNIIAETIESVVGKSEADIEVINGEKAKAIFGGQIETTVNSLE